MAARNAGPAGRLAQKPGPQGLCALAIDEDSKMVHAVPTLDPAAAINLEYFSYSLAVKRDEGREAYFSLDPVDPQNTNSMQIKRFEPHWLKRTSVGEVMF